MAEPGRPKRRRSKSVGDSSQHLARKSFPRRISHEGASHKGINGFDELRRFIKQGNVFCQEVGAIMQERSDLENNYAKALTKLSAKLTKASANCIGTLASSWAMVSNEMESQADLHRTLGQALHDDIYRPIKQAADLQHKTRKPIEASVDKALKNLVDKRSDEAKCKKLAFNAAKEREKLCDQLHNAKSGRGKTLSDKEMTKLEKKVRVINETVSKADRDYHNAAQVAEQHRQEWETCVYKGSSQLQNLEEERICQMQDLLARYNSHLSVLGPKMVQCCDRLGEAALAVNVREDVQLAIDSRGTGPNQPEQLLLDYYAEDESNTMDKTRRKQALHNYLISLQQDIEREKKGREGLERLLDVYQNRPNFGDSDTQEESRQRLSHMAALLHYLEACQWKISGALNSLENRPTYESRYSQYIERNKDKSGCMVSILRMPIADLSGGFISPQIKTTSPWNNATAPSNGIDENFVARLGRRSSTSSSISGSIVSRQSSREQTAINVRKLSEASARKSMAPPPPPHYGDLYPDDDDFDDFDYNSPTVLGQCRAIYDYTAQHHDELSIRAGELITLYSKQEDGWWQGQSQSGTGMFPATYVEELGAAV